MVNDEKSVEELSNVLLNARKDKGYSLQKASIKTGISHSFISQLERGKRPIPIPKILRQFAEGYNLDYEYLMVKAGYLDEPRTNVNDDYLMFKDKEAFDSLTPEDKQKVLTALHEQADFMIAKYKKNKGD